MIKIKSHIINYFLMEFGSKAFEGAKNEKREVKFPKIFELIEAGASTQNIVHQLMMDFYSPERDKEKICIGIMELLHRDLEGRAALDYISRDSGEIGDIIQRIIKRVGNKIEYSSSAVEGELGLKRVNSYLCREEDDNIRINEYYKIAKEKGLFEGSFMEFVKILFEDQDEIGQLTGKTERELVSVSATFGNSEPGYLEALGPINVLHLKRQQKPEFLLLGSLGKYSTIEFNSFAKNINENSKTNVVDIGWDMQPMFEDLKVQHGIDYKIGNVLDLPYKDNSMDLIASNFLFHSLFVGGPNVSREHIYKLMQQVHRVLKPGGIALLCERPYGKYQDDEKSLMENGAEVVDEICAVARKAGLEVFSVNDGLKFLFRQEASSGTIIDSNGFAQYENKTIMEGYKNQLFCLRKKR